MDSLLGRPSATVGEPSSPPRRYPFSYIDLFCGIGGFHLAAASLGMECVFACDIDEEARTAYAYNFGLLPLGDITRVQPAEIPKHDLLFAGFPCQPFSIIGKKDGFADPRGTLFLEIVRILDAKRPLGFVLENVKQLVTLQNGAVMRRILHDLESLGYDVEYRVLNALDFGLPQKRERTIIVGSLTSLGAFPWPEEPVPMLPLSEILEDTPDTKYFVSDRIREKRHKKHVAKHKPAIWHENKAGNISSYPWSCALRAGASYNYLLVDGERRLTPREMLRLQGFPDSFEIVCNDSQTRKQAGNAVPVPLVRSAIKGIAGVIESAATKRISAEAKWSVPIGTTTR